MVSPQVQLNVQSEKPGAILAAQFTSEYVLQPCTGTLKALAPGPEPLEGRWHRADTSQWQISVQAPGRKLPAICEVW